MVNLEFVKNILSKTLASDLVSAKPEKSMEQIYKERCDALEELLKSMIGDDEQIVYGFSLDDGREVCHIEKKPLEIDLSKHVKLTDEDYDIISESGIDVAKIVNCDYKCGISDRDDDIYIIRTPSWMWNQLCGREWHYNLKTKEIKLVKIN